jgi:hypothetical protein
MACLAGQDHQAAQSPRLPSGCGAPRRSHRLSRSRGLKLSIQVGRCEDRGAEAAQRLFLARVTAALRAASRRLRVVAALRPAARRFRVIAAFWPGVSVTLGLAFMISPFPLNGRKSRAKLIELGFAHAVRTGDSTPACHL